MYYYYYYCCCITCREDDRPNKYILYAREINIGSKATVVAAAAQRQVYTYMIGHGHDGVYPIHII